MTEPAHPGSLLVIAEKLLEQYHTIPDAALPVLQAHLGIPSAELRSILSFYRYPFGDRAVHCRVEICTAASCHLKTGTVILQTLLRHFGVEPGKVSADGRLLINTVNCLSACDRAPAITINASIHSGITPEQAVALVDEALK